MVRRMCGLLLAAVLFTALSGFAEIYAPDSSNRVKINLGATPWKFIQSDPIGAQNLTYNDAAAPNVGIPHCFAEDQTFVNNASGG
jgi:beta-galactosidase